MNNQSQIALDTIREWIEDEDNEANQNYLELLYEEIEERVEISSSIEEFFVSPRLSIDSKIVDITTENKNMLVFWYLILSYLKHEKGVSIVDESSFEFISVILYSDWDKIHHIHKHLIDKETLIPATECCIKNYPSTIKGAAEKVYEDWKLKEGK